MGHETVFDAWLDRALLESFVTLAVEPANPSDTIFEPASNGSV